LVVWDLVTRHTVKRLPLGFQPRNLELDPEGRRIAVNAADPPFQVQVRHLDTGRVLNWWTDQVGNGRMSWSQDGRLLAIGHFDGRVFIWDTVPGRLASMLQGHAAAVVACQFAPASELLATGAWDGTMRLWDAAAGEALLTTSDWFLGFAPDGRRAAFLDGPTLCIRDVPRDQEVRTLNPAGIGNRTETTPDDEVR